MWNRLFITCDLIIIHHNYGKVKRKTEKNLNLYEFTIEMAIFEFIMLKLHISLKLIIILNAIAQFAIAFSIYIFRKNIKKNIRNTPEKK